MPFQVHSIQSNWLGLTIQNGLGPFIAVSSAQSNSSSCWISLGFGIWVQSKIFEIRFQVDWNSGWIGLDSITFDRSRFSWARKWVEWFDWDSIEMKTKRTRIQVKSRLGNGLGGTSVTVQPVNLKLNSNVSTKKRRNKNKIRTMSPCRNISLLFLSAQHVTNRRHFLLRYR